MDLLAHVVEPGTLVPEVTLLVGFPLGDLIWAECQVVEVGHPPLERGSAVELVFGAELVLCCLMGLGHGVAQVAFGGEFGMAGGGLERIGVVGVGCAFQAGEVAPVGCEGLFAVAVVGGFGTVGEVAGLLPGARGAG